MKAVWFILCGLWIGLALSYFFGRIEPVGWVVGLLCLTIAWDDFERGRAA